MSWEQVAADGNDPQLVARVVALTTDAHGRAALSSAAGDSDGLFGEGQGTAGALLPSPTTAQWRAADDARAAWHDLGVRVVLRGAPGWPERLERVSGRPAFLAWRGPDVLPSRPAVAIVGARRATPYGTGVAAWLAEAAADAGVTVVSGGARGVDAAAHGAASGGATTVVLGCGHGVGYPRPHARPGGFFARVLEGGGAVVSELLPGEQPRPYNVRARNRIVAGLADVVVVVEGRQRSGSLVTAGVAADAGVEVLAVPGDVRAPGSAAPHQLLREGATPCTGPEDLLAALRIEVAARTGGDAPGAAVSTLPSALHDVLVEAWPRPVRAEDLADRSRLGVGTVLAAVTRARVAGDVVETADGVRFTRSPTPDRR